VRALRQRVGTLDVERRRLLARIQQLEERVEVLYGELYVKRGEPPPAHLPPVTGSPAGALRTTAPGPAPERRTAESLDLNRCDLPHSSAGLEA
jgi:hypothetical protein